MRDEYIASATPARSPLHQALGQCSYISEDEFAAQCCYIGPRRDDCEAAAVTLRTLKWQFVHRAGGFDQYEILGVGAQDPAALRLAAGMRSEVAGGRPGRVHGPGSQAGVVLESSERQCGTGEVWWGPAGQRQEALTVAVGGPQRPVRRSGRDANADNELDMLDDMLASTRAAQRLERAALCLPQPASKRRRSSLCEEFVHIFDELDPQQALFDAVQDTSNCPFPHPSRRPLIADRTAIR